MTMTDGSQHGATTDGTQCGAMTGGTKHGAITDGAQCGAMTCEHTHVEDTGLEFTNRLAWLAIECWGTSCLYLPSIGTISMCVYMPMLSIELGSSYLHGKYLTDVAISPAPCIVLKASCVCYLSLHPGPSQMRNSRHRVS